MRTLVCGVALLVIAMPSAAMAEPGCFAGTDAYLAGRVDDAIILFEDALGRADCVADRPGLLLNLGTALADRAHATDAGADHCLAARHLTEAVNTTDRDVRERARVRAEIETMRCTSSQRLDAFDPVGARRTLAAFVDRHATSADALLSAAVADARRRSAEIDAIYFGALELRCPPGAIARVTGVLNTALCPVARWDDVPVGPVEVTVETTDGQIVVQHLQIEPGAVTTHHFAIDPVAPPPGPEPEAPPPAPEIHAVPGGVEQWSTLEKVGAWTLLTGTTSFVLSFLVLNVVDEGTVGAQIGTGMFLGGLGVMFLGTGIWAVSDCGEPDVTAGFGPGGAFVRGRF